MEREILFRAKSNTNVWKEGFLVKCENNHDKLFFEIGKDGFKKLEWITANYYGQYTGLKDKFETKIFEHDITNFGIVFFENGCFKLKLKSGNVLGLLSNYIIEGIEVIGNIYDNPELLCK